MINIVCDTNVLVSGLMNPLGAPGEIIRQIAEAQLIVSYDARILAEYRKVLMYTKFNFNNKAVDGLIDQIQTRGIFVRTTPLEKELPHKNDEMFLEAAIATNTKYLVTGNLKHFPKSHMQNIEAIAPAKFLEIICL